jgi:hypothetical protein
MREKALNGDARAMERFLEYGRMLEGQTAGPTLPDSTEDEQILAAEILAGDALGDNTFEAHGACVLEDRAAVAGERLAQLYAVEQRLAPRA